MHRLLWAGSVLAGGIVAFVGVAIAGAGLLVRARVAASRKQDPGFDA